MARKYVNPAGSVTPVTDKLLIEARARAEAAAARFRQAEHADPLASGWDAEFESATMAARATARRVEALEQARAAQIERGGKRDAALKSAAGDLKSIASGLTATRDAVAAAAAQHLKSLAALAVAEQAHNALLAQSRARLAELGLRVRDDLVDDGGEHAEGVLDSHGLRAGGTDWTPIPAAGVVAHGLRQVFGHENTLHPLSQVGRFTWRAHEVESRPDELRVPTLADAGVVPPETMPRVIARSAPLADVLPPREDVPGHVNVSGYEPAAPRRGRTAR